MVAYTKDHAKAGTTEFIATIYTLVPDKDGLIDSGGISYREDAEHSPSYKTLRGAQNWVARQTGNYADIYKSEWVEDSFPDDQYGIVFDAYTEPEQVATFWNDGYGWKMEAL